MDRKEIKQDYKNNPPPLGIFQIQNAKNNKLLIGSTMDLTRVWNRHHFQLRMGCHVNQALQSDWSACGPEAFSFEVLETVNQEKVPQEDWRDTLAGLEKKWLEKLQPYGDRGYNKPPAARRQTYEKN
ncbi:MAG TPA: GIY-YIG nuclease family protein [Selenomonadales bacterium]|nr:GIY-YIG nuclease family protein [Selenomonadales bacterium]